MTQPSLFTPPSSKRMADTSLEAFAQISRALTKRQVIVFRGLHAYLEATGHPDATGGELTEFLKRRGDVRDVNGCRPRLTDLCDLGWINSGTSRTCRAYGTSAHPYWPVFPLSALPDLNPKDGGQ